MVIQRLVYITKGVGFLWLDDFNDGLPSIKWAKAFVEDPHWGLTEDKMCRNILFVDSRLNRIDPSTNMIFPPDAERGYRTKF